jgi:UrcA family protein
MHSPALLLAAVLALSPGFAQPWARPPEPVKMSETISYADLDLSTTEGARAMLVRIRAAVARTCVQPRSQAMPRADTEEWRCRGTALTQALKDLNAPLVTAAAGGRLPKP